MRMPEDVRGSGGGQSPLLLLLEIRELFGIGVFSPPECVNPEGRPKLALGSPIGTAREAAWESINGKWKVTLAPGRPIMGPALT